MINVILQKFYSLRCQDYANCSLNRDIIWDSQVNSFCLFALTIWRRKHDHLHNWAYARISHHWPVSFGSNQCLASGQLAGIESRIGKIKLVSPHKLEYTLFRRLKLSLKGPFWASGQLDDVTSSSSIIDNQCKALKCSKWKHNKNMIKFMLLVRDPISWPTSVHMSRPSELTCSERKNASKLQVDVANLLIMSLPNSSKLQLKGIFGQTWWARKKKRILSVKSH